MFHFARKYWLLLPPLLAVAAGALLVRVPRTNGPMPHEAFVWQRAWNESVRRGVREHAGEFAALIVLGAEVNFRDSRPEAHRVAIDWSTLRAADCPVGLALRVGPHTGPFGREHPATRRLTELAASLVTEARTNRVTVAELQLDFDCAETRLAGYRGWLEEVRRAVPDTRLTFTALPSWLDRWAFRALARAADGYVLQVHSLRLPAGASAPPPLCDPVKARRAVEWAARFGRPFRVALPTHGYVAGFAPDGKLLGVSAEGPSPAWPAFARLQPVMADAPAMAELVAGWTRDRPAAMQGVVWYRLPVDGDRLNWRWPTLATVMRSETPRAELVAEAIARETNLLEINLTNQGRADAPLDREVAIQWKAARLLAGDGLGGFDLATTGAGTVRLSPGPNANPPRLAPGGRIKIAWLRFNQPVEAHVEIPDQDIR